MLPSPLTFLLSAGTEFPCAADRAEHSRILLVLELAFLLSNSRFTSYESWIVVIVIEDLTCVFPFLAARLNFCLLNFDESSVRCFQGVLSNRAISLLRGQLSGHPEPLDGEKRGRIRVLQFLDWISL